LATMRHKSSTYRQIQQNTQKNRRPGGALFFCCILLYFLPSLAPKSSSSNSLWPARPRGGDLLAIVVPTYVRTSGGSGGRTEGDGGRTEGDGGSKIFRRREMAEDGGRSAGDGGRSAGDVIGGLARDSCALAGRRASAGGLD